MAIHSSNLCLGNPMDREAWQPIVQRAGHDLAIKQQQLGESSRISSKGRKG